MGRDYNVIDADGHILEPFDLWNTYTDPKYRDRAPRLVEDENGKRRLIIEERAAGDPQRGFGSIGARQGAVKATELKYEEGRPGGFDPHKRIPDMDLDGHRRRFSLSKRGAVCWRRARPRSLRRAVPRL
jgi:uncharacterized protein